MEKINVLQAMFSIRLNKKQTEIALRKLFFYLKLQTKARLHEKNQENIEAVGKKKALRLNIVDNSGNTITVGGSLLFTGYREGKVSNLRPAKTLHDLQRLGYKIFKVHIFQKQDQDFGFLRIYMSQTEHTPWIPKSKEQVAFIKTHFERHYRMCVGFIHPHSTKEPANTTFNFGGPITDSIELKEKNEDLKHLRIMSDCHPQIYRFDKIQK